VHGATVVRLCDLRIQRTAIRHAADLERPFRE